MHNSPRGYSLIEFLIVASIFGLVAMMVLFGVRPTQNAEEVKAAAKQLLSDLSSQQSKALNGVPSSAGVTGFKFRSVTLNGADYQIDSTLTVVLPKNITMSTAGVVVCFANPAAKPTDLTGACACGAWTCPTQPSPFRITLKRAGAPDRNVYIEGTGISVTRMYESDK